MPGKVRVGFVDDHDSGKALQNLFQFSQSIFFSAWSMRTRKKEQVDPGGDDAFNRKLKVFIGKRDSDNLRALYGSQRFIQRLTWGKHSHFQVLVGKAPNA